VDPVDLHRAAVTPAVEHAIAHDALDGVQRAAEAVDSGAARDRLAQWAALTEALAA